MRKKRTMGLALAAVAIVVVLAGAGAVMAQSGGDDPATPAADGQPRFIDRVAEKLGIEGAALEQAMRDVRNEDIDAAVARGDLTQEQADKLKEKLDALPELPGHPGFGVPFGGPPFGGPPFEGPPFDRHGFPGGPGAFKFGFGIALPEQEEALAGFLGVTVEQLRTELQADGATLAAVAEAHGRSRDDLKAFLLESATQKLDEAVASGGLPREHADQIKARLAEHLDKLIDHGLGMFKGGRMHAPGDGSGFRFEFNGEWMESAPASAPSERTPES